MLAFLWLYSSIQGYGLLYSCTADYFEFSAICSYFLISDSPLLCARFKPATVIISSELPLGSGLGSSAALCVAFSGALLAFSDCASLDLGHQGWLDFGESELDLLNKWAFEGEKILHGKPSGIDNTVSTYGKLSCHLSKTDLPSQCRISSCFPNLLV